MTETRWPWPQQVMKLGEVWVMRDVDPTNARSLANRWARRHGYTVKTASIDDVMLLCWTQNPSGSSRSTS